MRGNRERGRGMAKTLGDGIFGLQETLGKNSKHNESFYQEPKKFWELFLALIPCEI